MSDATTLRDDPRAHRAHSIPGLMLNLIEDLQVRLFNVEATVRAMSTPAQVVPPSAAAISDAAALAEYNRVAALDTGEPVIAPE